jgi:hypothetical protein
MRPPHPQGMNQYHDLELNQGLNLRRVQCNQHEREDSNPIQRLWRPLGARSCKAAEPFEKDSTAILIHPTHWSSTPR